MYSRSTSYYDLGAASGFHALILGLVLKAKINIRQQKSYILMRTYVEYVLKAARLAVKFGRCSGSSHFRTPVRRRGSSVGGLSTMYEIQACHPGSICDLYWCQNLRVEAYEVEELYASSSFSL